MSEQWWLKDFRLAVFWLAVFQENSELLVFFWGVCESESWNSCRFPGGRSNTSLYVTGRRHWKTLPLFEHVDFFSTWRYVFFQKENISIKCWFSKESWYRRSDGRSQHNWESKRVDLEKTIHFSQPKGCWNWLRVLCGSFGCSSFQEGCLMSSWICLCCSWLMFWRSTVFVNNVPYQKIGSHGSCTIFDRLWVARNLTTWFGPTKQNILGWTRGKYRDKRTNQVQTTYGPEDQHGTWE